MKKGLIALSVAGLLLFSGTALADEQKKEDDHSGHSTTQTQTEIKKEEVKSSPTPATESSQTHNMTADEHKNMSTSGHTETEDSHGEDSATLEEESSEGGHGGHGDLEESPPNVPVLSTFGAINAAFLLYGVWNKWLSKKGGAFA